MESLKHNASHYFYYNLCTKCDSEVILLKKKGVPSAESSRSVRGLGKGVSGKPYPRLCNAPVQCEETRTRDLPVTGGKTLPLAPGPPFSEVILLWKWNYHWDKYIHIIQKDVPSQILENSVTCDPQFQPCLTKVFDCLWYVALVLYAVQFNHFSSFLVPEIHF